MRALTLLTVVILCGACSKGAKSANSTVSTKSLHSKWKSESPAWTMDLSTDDQVTWTYYFTGGKCQSASGFTWSDDENSGWLVVVSTATVTAVSGDPTCNQFTRTWKYDNLASGHLILCPQTGPSDCVEFE